jgi:diphosphomevalonate decarboxylase
MYKKELISNILGNNFTEPKYAQGNFFAPSNIALCKYWGKRNTELNLPLTSSLSISLGTFGATTHIGITKGTGDEIELNGSPISATSDFAISLKNFLDLFRFERDIYYQIKTDMNIPVGAGLASSACGYAALVGALDQLYGWNLSLSDLSILARLGSGSACRSFWQGFVEWQAGTKADGMDSLGVPLLETWPSLRIGLLIFNPKQKILSSRAAMERTVETSPFYSAWPAKQAKDLQCLKIAIQNQDFQILATTAESNALAMHALMLSASPTVLYSEAQTIAAMHTVFYAGCGT